MIDHNELLDSGARYATGDSSQTGSGITVNWNAAGLANAGYNIRRNLIVGAWGYGITAMHLDGAVIADNEVAETSHAALALNRARDLRVVRNVITRQTSDYLYDAIVRAGIQLPVGPSADPGLEAPFTTPSERIMVANNIIRGVTWGVGNFCIDGLADPDLATWQDVTIAHNTFVDTLEPIAFSSACGTAPTPSSISSVNNASVRSPDANMGEWAEYDHNCWDASPGTMSSPTDITGSCGLADTTTPSFTAYAPEEGAPVLGAGAVVPDVTDDILCRARLVSSPTLGAHEAPLPE